jgi:hypothetical protein
MTPKKGTVVRNNVLSVMRGFAGKENFITIPKTFIDFCDGDMIIAAFFSQCLYWTGITDDPEGWIVKSYEDWEEEIRLSRTQVVRCVAALEQVGLRVKKARSRFHSFAPVLHYRFDVDVLTEKAEAFFENASAETLHMRGFRKSNLKVSNKSKVEDLSKSFNTESMEETTEEEKEIALATQDARATDPFNGDNTPAPAPTQTQGKTKGKATTPPSKVAPKVSPTRKLSKLEREIMTLIDENPKSRVTPQKENMDCAANLCDEGLMVCERSRGMCLYSLTDLGKSLLSTPSPAAALGLAWGVVLVQGDYPSFGKVASALTKSGITPDEFASYVEYWRTRSVKEGWTLATVHALTGPGRMSEYVAWKAEQARLEAETALINPPRPRREVSDAERELTRKKVQMMNANPHYIYSDDDWRTGDYVPAQRTTQHE